MLEVEERPFISSTDERGESGMSSRVDSSKTMKKSIDDRRNGNRQTREKSKRGIKHEDGRKKAF